MNLLLVTGAGASRNLAQKGQHMPLMPDWSNRLCEALDVSEANLASSCHLEPWMSGEQFEENLGLLLRWDQVRHLEERFENVGGPQAGSRWTEVAQARQNTTNRIAVVLNALHDTLYAEFGQAKVDDAKAAAAYGALLGELGAEEQLILATTNYDRSAEAALNDLGHRIDTGFKGPFGRTPTLQPSGMVENRGDSTPVLHLHGAVGWYDKDGAVEDHYADQPYNPSLGSPVVLYPDPEKDPTSDAIVSQLWTEFRQALSEADHVLVLGHSLHDPALVRSLKDTARDKKVAITHHSPEGANRARDLIPECIPIKTDFGPKLDIDRSGVAAFRG
jgi:hypothetical protein